MATLERFRQAGLLENRIGRNSIDDIRRYRKMPARDRAVPDFVTAFALAHESAARISQSLGQLAVQRTGHDGSAHVPAKACPGLDPGWVPVRRPEHAPLKILYCGTGCVSITKRKRMSRAGIPLSSATSGAMSQTLSISWSSVGASVASGISSDVPIQHRVSAFWIMETTKVGPAPCGAFGTIVVNTFMEWLPLARRADLAGRYGHIRASEATPLPPFGAFLAPGRTRPQPCP